MYLDNKSLNAIKKAPIPSIFSIDISDNTIIIREEIDENSIEGNILIYDTDETNAFDISYNYQHLIGYLIYINNNYDIRIISKPKIDLTCSDLFEKLKQLMKNFENRRSQIQMAADVENVLNKQTFGIFEAETGVGKSLAYLIPAIIYSKQNKKKIVVTTNTINLQRQLIYKDLPLLKNIIKFNAQLALGRNNYLCRRRVDSLFAKGNIFLFENKIYESLKEVADSTETGLKSDVPRTAAKSIYPIWDSICSTTSTCIHSKCRYFKKGCFYYRAKQKLNNADLIVANHHMVFSDAAMKDAEVLPEYDAIIFDEAHNIEKSATNYFTQTVYSKGIFKLIEKLYTRRNKKDTGLIVSLENDIQNTLKPIISHSKSKIKKAFEQIKTKLFKNGLEKEISITNNVKNIIEDDIIQIKDCLNDITSSIKHLKSKIKSSENTVEIMSIVEECDENNYLLGEVLVDAQENVRWIKYTKDNIHINITPINIADALKDSVYTNVKSAIFTSATMSVNGDFTFLKRNIGIENSEDFIYKSSFNYKKNAKLFSVMDNNEPNNPQYLSNLAENIIKAAEGLGGDRGMIILFTSYAMLNRLYDATKYDLKNLNFLTLKQGEFDNFEMLKNFKHRKSVLFGTSSFWEGIDVKGDYLSLVLITRLPFDVPNTPIEKAKYNIIKNMGQNSFLEYALPKAVLKFRQGFGRLIRSKYDRGIILVSDPRIVNKSYGKLFLNSLPEITMEAIKKDEIQDKISDFFSDHN